MDGLINIYCDESRHLLNDRQKAMVLGALWCLGGKTQNYNMAIAELKNKHNLSKYFEIKWTKVSPGKSAFYHELIDFFFDSVGIGFRAWVVPDKSVLDHDEFGQSHDDWYYKMYFYLLRNLIWPQKKYNVYLDIKDTRSRTKIVKLQEVLQNAHYDYQREVIQKVQHVHSHDIGLLQLSDLLLGAVAYKACGLSNSPAKCEIIEHIKQRSGLSLERNTLPSEKKFNLCFWNPDSGGFIHA